MNWKNLLTYLAAATTVASCGGESESKAPDINIEVIEEIIIIEGPEPEPEPEDNIVNTSLPIIENFNAATDAATFFSAAYAPLNTESASTDEDNFYHSTAGVFLDDGSLDPNPNTWITGDADPHFRLGNSRFTVGQIVSVYADPGALDPRKNSTPGTIPSTQTTSWGELDLSTSYTVSFCVVDHSSSGTFFIYVDNNSTSSGNSILGSGSRVVNDQVNTLTVGQRASFAINTGTTNSFIQLRVDSGGWVVMDDLVIENAANPAPTQPDCSTKTTEYGTDPNGPPASAPATAPTNLAVVGAAERLDISWDALAEATEYDIAYNTTDSVTGATVIADITSLSTSIPGLTAGIDYYVFVRGSNSVGDGPYSASVVGQPTAAVIPDNVDRTWSTANGELNETIYASVLTNPTPTTTNNNFVNPTDTTVNGLHIFTTNDTALRHRGSNANEINFNGTSYQGGNAETTEAIGAPADALRTYIGVPVDPTLAVDIVVNHRSSTGGGADPAVLIVFIGGTSGNVLCTAPAFSDVAADTTCSLAASHGESEVRVIFSREGATSGGMHVSSIGRVYGAVTLTDRTWSSATGEFDEADFTSILVNLPPTTSNNNFVNPTDATINDLHIFTTNDSALRHRGSNANEFNFNGTSYQGGNSETTEAIGAPADALRTFIGVPVDPTSAVDVIVNHRSSTGGGADPAVLIVFIGGTSGNVLCTAPAFSDVAADTTCSLAASHGESEVRIIFSREGATGGGMHLNAITVDYP